MTSDYPIVDSECTTARYVIFSVFVLDVIVSWRDVTWQRVT